MKTRTWPILAALAVGLLGAALAAADTLTLTSGAITLGTNGSQELNLAGPGFIVNAGTNPGEFLLGAMLPPCFSLLASDSNCGPGRTTPLSIDVIPTTGGGEATYLGKTYPVGLNNPRTSWTVSAGDVILPPLTASTFHVVEPFTVRFDLHELPTPPPGIAVDLVATGSGVATFDFAVSPGIFSPGPFWKGTSGVYIVATPEPGTLLFAITAVAGLSFLAWRRRAESS